MASFLSALTRLLTMLSRLPGLGVLSGIADVLREAEVAKDDLEVEVRRAQYEVGATSRAVGDVGGASGLSGRSRADPQHEYEYIEEDNE